MIYRRESIYGQRKERKLSRALKELREEGELLAEEAEELEFQHGKRYHGRTTGEILRGIEDEAFVVLGMCEYVRKLLEEGVRVCHI